MRAYIYDNSDLDQREPHDSGIAVSPEELKAIRVDHFRLEGDMDKQIEQLDKICQERGYRHRDQITISPQALSNYDEMIKKFFKEHLHEDEEIRFIKEGSGFFDVRDKQDRWVRIVAEKSDLIFLPAGIYHRFTLDTNNYLEAIRIFKEDPKWKPLNRPESDDNSYRTKYLSSIGAN
ncbi:1,2-dihydroxy-3-keto-5-methylthiopentene dioxygenase [Mycoemilia scoparia]|uniref:Acireductone dioxygenase n=1 Tax=Mycoemilia scoparia TaxID=417184 RepID=A0A9W8DVA3_9FUNG|nr:1,2-dihydroxy-3-keto-5-methylthiopentene dioxygenase [Mycoemilia scoparia]